MRRKLERKETYMSFEWDIHLPVHKITAHEVSFAEAILDVRGTQKQRIFLTLKPIEYSWNHKTKL